MILCFWNGAEAARKKATMNRYTRSTWIELRMGFELLEDFPSNYFPRAGNPRKNHEKKTIEEHSAVETFLRRLGQAQSTLCQQKKRSARKSFPSNQTEKAKPRNSNEWDNWSINQWKCN